MTPAQVVREELFNGPDARNPVPSGCPVCGGDLAYEQVILWRYYPDMNQYEIWCEGCALWAAVEV